MSSSSLIAALDYIAGNGCMFQNGSKPIYRLRSYDLAIDPDLLPVIIAIMVKAGWAESECRFMRLSGRIVAVYLGVERSAGA